MALISSLGIFVASLLMARLSGVFIENYLSKIAARTATNLDDRILKSAKTPVFFAILLIGTQVAVLGSGLENIIPASQIFYGLWVTLVAFVLISEGGAFLNWVDDESRARPGGGAFGDILPVISHIWKLVVVVIAVLMVLDNFGAKITPLLASLGIAGLAVALAFQDTLANFFAGMYIVADRPIKIGDFIRLDTGDDGYVEKIGWRSTRIKTMKNNFVIVPNSKLAQSVIKNYYSPTRDMSVVVDCSVAYESDLAKVEKITVEVARTVLKETKGGIKEFEPFIRYHTFGDSGIAFSVILRVEKYDDRYPVVHEFIKALHERYQREGIEIPYPKRHVYLEDLGRKGK